VSGGELDDLETHDTYKPISNILKVRRMALCTMQDLYILEAPEMLLERAGINTTDGGQ